ncbi:AzlD domain-containing protein [Rhodococcus sp. NPDC058505]|uniref:AzlD domain-containing protein n=1 Tax=unclassified Rhodococcus (in: high G+C Gram-positive bacteria) TaxID=192944 RepID=UPI00364A870C
MTAGLPLIVAVLVLGAGTFAFRFAGPALRSRGIVPDRLDTVLALGAIVLLAAVAATQALTEDGGAAGIARPAGVLVGGVLVWRRAPFVVAILAAAATAALLRLLGVP